MLEVFGLSEAALPMLRDVGNQMPGPGGAVMLSGPGGRPPFHSPRDDRIRLGRWEYWRKELEFILFLDLNQGFYVARVLVGWMNWGSTGKDSIPAHLLLFCKVPYFGDDDTLSRVGYCVFFIFCLFLASGTGGYLDFLLPDLIHTHHNQDRIQLSHINKPT